MPELTDEAKQLLDDLEAATNEYADRELSKLRRRAARLRNLNTRIDDFSSQTELAQASLVATDIASMLESVAVEEEA